MPLANPSRNLFNLGSNADVARLGLPADLLRDALELLAPAREEHTAPPTCGERARDGRALARRTWVALCAPRARARAARARREGGRRGGRALRRRHSSPG